MTLTPEGDRVATALVRRHRILERWLTDVLGFDWAAADVEADRLSSAVSDAVVDRIDASMDSPATCPHGNVIPGRDAPYGELVALADLEPGIPATIRRISEVAEHEARALLLMLAEHAIKEGSEVRATDARLGPSDVAIVIAGQSLTLSIEAARLIWVETAPGAARRPSRRRVEHRAGDESSSPGRSRGLEGRPARPSIPST